MELQMPSQKTEVHNMPEAVQVSRHAEALLLQASEMYELGQTLTPQGFLLIKGAPGYPASRVILVPIVIEMTAEVLEAMDRNGLSPQDLSMQAVTNKAGTLPMDCLVAVAYMVPVEGQFPLNKQDEASALGWSMTGLPVSDSPWAREGLVLVVDTPDGRVTWACVRGMGKKVDPLCLPKLWPVDMPSIKLLYPVGETDFEA